MEADIEGVLIRGAQGERSLSVLPLARATGISGVAHRHLELMRRGLHRGGDPE